MEQAPKRVRVETMIQGLRDKNPAVFAEGLKEVDGATRRYLLASEVDHAGMDRFAESLMAVTRGSYTLLNQVLGMLSPHAAAALRHARRGAMRGAIVSEIRGAMNQVPPVATKVKAIIDSDPAFVLALILKYFPEDARMWSWFVKATAVPVLVEGDIVQDAEAQEALYAALAQQPPHPLLRAQVVDYIKAHPDFDGVPPAVRSHVARLCVVLRVWQHWTVVADWVPGWSDLILETVTAADDSQALSELLKAADKDVRKDALTKVERCEIDSVGEAAVASATQSAATLAMIDALYAQHPEVAASRPVVTCAQALLAAALGVIAFVYGPESPRAFAYAPTAVLTPDGIFDFSEDGPPEEDVPPQILHLRNTALSCRRSGMAMLRDDVVRAVLNALPTMSVDVKTLAAVRLAATAPCHRMWMNEENYWFEHRNVTLGTDPQRQAYGTYMKAYLEWMFLMVGNVECIATLFEEVNMPEAAAAFRAREQARATRWSVLRRLWTRAVVVAPPRKPAST